MLMDLVWDAAVCATAMRENPSPVQLIKLNAANKTALELIQAELDAGGDPSTCASLNEGSHAYTNAIIISAANGDLAALRLLLASPLADVNVVDSDQDTALLMAAKNGQAHCIAELLAAGARLDVCNRDGSTPLMLAVASEVVESCAILAPISQWSWEDRCKNGATIRQMALRSPRQSHIFELLSADMEARLLNEACPATKKSAGSARRGAL